MKKCQLAALLLIFLPGACIAPSVVAKEDRAVALEAEETAWRPGTESDLPGTFVSTELTGPLAASLRKIVYLFESGGTYTGAGLIDGVPPYFAVTSGHWRLFADGLRLDEGAPAVVEVAEDGSLRLTGDEGRVVLRRERDR